MKHKGLYMPKELKEKNSAITAKPITAEPILLCTGYSRYSHPNTTTSGLLANLKEKLGNHRFNFIAGLANRLALEENPQSVIIPNDIAEEIFLRNMPLTVLMDFHFSRGKLTCTLDKEAASNIALFVDANGNFRDKPAQTQTPDAPLPDFNIGPVTELDRILERTKKEKSQRKKLDNIHVPGILDMSERDYGGWGRIKQNTSELSR